MRHVRQSKKRRIPTKDLLFAYGCGLIAGAAWWEMLTR
jgi:hypothetical protein